MYSYNLEQWLLFFYIYCFAGWIWESCYVSVKKKKWVNRGFIHGPFLPLYGSGAIAVLFLTLPVRDNYILVFLLGMTGATILEYFTGAVMEKLFQVRYWDYSKLPFNLNGHICLFCSLGWGAFSVILVHFVHAPVERFVFWIPEYISDIAAFVITILFVVDFTQAFNEALDLKEVLVNATEHNEKLKRLEKRIDVVAAVIDDDIRQLQSKGVEGIHAIEEKIREQKSALLKDRRYKRSVRMVKRNPDAVSAEFAEAMKDIKFSAMNKIEKKKRNDA